MLAKLPKNAWIVKLRNENCPLAGGIPALQWCTTVGPELRYRCIDFTWSVQGSSGSNPQKPWYQIREMFENVKYVEIIRITLATSTVLWDEAFTPHADGRPDGWAFVGDAVSWVAICNHQTFFVEKRPHFQWYNFSVCLRLWPQPPSQEPLVFGFVAQEWIGGKTWKRFVKMFWVKGLCPLNEGVFLGISHW